MSSAPSRPAPRPACAAASSASRAALLSTEAIASRSAGRAALEREQQRQRDLALAQVGEGALAELRLAGLVVERVVAQLEGEAELAPVLGELAPLGAGDAAQDRARLAGRRQQHGALVLDHREVVGLGHARIEAALELEQLALRHRADRGREDPQDVEVAVLDDHRGGARVEEIARPAPRAGCPRPRSPRAGRGAARRDRRRRRGAGWRCAAARPPPPPARNADRCSRRARR